jgi:predicted transcriptional regulator
MTPQPSFSELTARDIMTPHVKSVPENWTMQKFAAFLSENDISGSPVANEKGEVIGIATLKDIADFHFNSVHTNYDAQLDDEELREARRLRMLIFDGMAKMPVEVGDIMTPIVFSVDEDVSVIEVATLMMREHLHRVFVRKAGQISGIITTYDLLKLITRGDG